MSVNEKKCPVCESSIQVDESLCHICDWDDSPIIGYAKPDKLENELEQARSQWRNSQLKEHLQADIHVDSDNKEKDSNHAASVTTEEITDGVQQVDESIQNQQSSIMTWKKPLAFVVGIVALFVIWYMQVGHEPGTAEQRLVHLEKTKAMDYAGFPSTFLCRSPERLGQSITLIDLSTTASEITFHYRWRDVTSKVILEGTGVVIKNTGEINLANQGENAMGNVYLTNNEWLLVFHDENKKDVVFSHVI